MLIVSIILVPGSSLLWFWLISGEWAVEFRIPTISDIKDVFFSETQLLFWPNSWLLSCSVFKFWALRGSCGSTPTTLPCGFAIDSTVCSWVKSRGPSHVFLRLFFRKKQIFIEHLLYSLGIALPTRNKCNNSWCSFPPFPSPLICSGPAWVHHTTSEASQGIKKQQQKFPSKVASSYHQKVMSDIYAGCWGHSTQQVAKILFH